jgi:predicted nucleic acid-binding protein
LAGEVTTFSTIVLYEWLRGPRTDAEREAVDEFFASYRLVAFGVRESEQAALLYGQVRQARQRQADLTIAACAIEHGAKLWTLNEKDFADIPELGLYRG